MESFPNQTYIYNEDYAETNTSKSLLKALRQTGSEPVLWLNGDVVFDESLAGLLASKISNDRSFACVNTSQVGAEEVKYKTNDGLIRKISKRVDKAEGEAIGINFIIAAEKGALILRLDECDANDYYEAALEATIREDGAKVETLDTTSQLAMEVDSVADLEQVNRELN